MKTPNLSRLSKLTKESLFAVLSISATAFILMLSQRELIGEGVIAMVFLLSVAWCGYRWGLGAGSLWPWSDRRVAARPPC